MTSYRVKIRNKILEARDRLRPDIEVPDRFKARARFDQMKAWFPDREAIRYCEEYAQDYVGKPAPFLLGKSGDGKTHLLWATIRGIGERYRAAIDKAADLALEEMGRRIDGGQFPDEREVKWPDVPQILVTKGAEVAHEIRMVVEKKNLDEVIAKHRQEKLYRAFLKPILVVDDVEVMQMKDWLNEELYRIFDFRYEHSLPTALASNFDIHRLRTHVGDRIVRRMLDMTKPFDMTRLAKKK